MKILLLILAVLAVLAIGAAVAMYIVGSESSHLSELKDFWYVPLPLGLVALWGAVRKTPEGR